MATATATRASDDAFEYRARRTSAGGYYRPTASSDGRAGATYEVAERGGEHAEEETRTRRFDTASARGVTTFDARTCEAIEFVPIDAWSRDKANFEKLRSMRTFRLHRLWKAFATMRAHARRRKFRRARARFKESSAIYGDAFAGYAVPTMMRVYDACHSIARDARVFRREEAPATKVEESYEFDDEANLAPATYDARALFETLLRLANEGSTHIRDVASAISSDVEIAKDAIERRFLADLDERLQPMITATKRYRRRSSGTNGGKPALAPTIGDDRLVTASESRDAYPYTERALVAALRMKLESFERSIWMCFRVAISRARDASLEELTAYVRDARSSESAIFQTTFDFETSTLVPSSDAFERAIRDGAAAWTSSSLGERVGDAVDLRSLEDEEFENRIDKFCDLVRDTFASAQEALLVVETRLREKSPDAVADADGGDDESSMIERLSEIVARSNAFKKEVDALPGSIRPNDGAIAVDIVSLKRALKPVASATIDSACRTAVDWAAERAQTIAQKFTRVKTLDDNDDETKLSKIRDLRDEARELENVHLAMKRLGANIPDFDRAAFKGVVEEIENALAGDDGGYEKDETKHGGDR